MGITRVARFAGGSPGLLVLPAYIPNEDVTPLGYTMSNLVFAIIGVVIAMAVAFIASYVLFGIWARKGKLEMIFETGHAFGLRMKDGTGLLIHIGVDTVELKGKGFTVLKKAGDSVTAGEPVIKADLKVIRDVGFSAQTMLVLSEPLDDAKPVSFLPFGSEVTRGQRLN